MAFQPFNAIPQSQQAYSGLINAAGQKRGINPLFLSSIINAESSGNPNAQGPRTRFGHAQGLMQFLPSTFDEVAGRYDIKGNTFNPEANVEAGAAYYSELRDQFGNDQDALMAYNWGPGNVRKWIESGRNPDKVPTETKLYVDKVLGGAPSSLYAAQDPGAAVAGMQPVDPMTVQTASAPGMGPRPTDATTLSPMPPGQEINQLPPMMALQDDPAAMQTAAGDPDLLGQLPPGDLLSPAAAEEPGVLDSLWGKMSSDAGRAAMMDAGAALLAASGWSDRPITMGEALGSAMKAGSAGYRNAETDALNQRVVEAKIAEMDQKGASLGNLLTALGAPGAGAGGTGTGTDAAAAGGAVRTGGSGAGRAQPAKAPASASAAREQSTEEPTTFYSSLSKDEKTIFDVALATGDPSTIARAAGDIQGQRADMAAAQAEATTKGDKENFDRQDKLADDYSSSKSFITYQKAAPVYNNLMKAVSRGNFNAVDDDTLILSYYKTLEPESAVLEGERASAAQTATWLETAWNRWERETGQTRGKLPQHARESMVSTINERMQEYKKNYDANRDFYSKRAGSAGVDSSLILAPGYDLEATATFAPEGYTIPTGEAPAAAPTAPGEPQAVAPEVLQKSSGMSVENLAAMPLNSVVEDAQGRKLMKVQRDGKTGWIVLQPNE